MKTLLIAALLSLCATAAGAETVRIVALGASQTEGKGVARADAYPVQLERLLRSRGHDVTVANEGVSGDTTADIAARFDRAVPAGTSILILQPGTNDANAKGRRGTMGGEDTRANVEAMLAKARARGLRAVLLGFPGGGGGPIAKRHSALWYGQARKEIDDSYLQADGQHLTPEGYALLARKLADVVEPLLGR